MMYGLYDFTHMCIEYIFVLGYDDKENDLPSVMVRHSLHNPQVVGSIPMSDEYFFFFFCYSLMLFILI